MAAVSSNLVTNRRPTWAEISLTALQHNYRTILDYVAPEAFVCAIVKADAYGHGAVQCAKALVKEGAKWFGVCCLAEAVQLRQAGIEARILLMSGFFPGEEETLLRLSITPTIWTWQHIELLENAGHKLAKEGVGPAKVHLKVNTGMNRLGCEVEELPQLADALKQCAHVQVEGFCTHYASSEIVDGPALMKQSEAFENACEVLHGTGLRPEIMHMANSAAIVSRHDSWKQMVRPGLALYGYTLPFTSVVSGMPQDADELPVKPVLEWKTRIFNIREVEEGAQVGYNGAFIARSPMKVAAIPVGYADGLNRHLSSRGRVVVRNDYASIIGNISMDITTIDVTGIPGVSIGDEVTLISGFDINEDPNRRRISAWEHASHAGTIPYEILCNISRRVPRVYVE